MAQFHNIMSKKKIIILKLVRQTNQSSYSFIT